MSNAIIRIDIPTDYADEYKQWIIDGRLCYLEDGAWTHLKDVECKVEPFELTKRMKNRLVDKAEVLETFGELYDIFDDSREIQKEIDKIYDKINDLPYIDVEEKAIPVEWIENKLKCCDNINAEIFVKSLIREWEKEDEQKTSD